MDKNFIRGSLSAILVAFLCGAAFAFGDVIIGGGPAASVLKFMEPSGSGNNFVSFEATSMDASVAYVLPNSVGSPRTVLQDLNGDGHLSWGKADYGSFYDTSTQSITSTTTAYLVGINTTDLPDGISIQSGSKITVSKTGIYNLQFSIQFVNTDGSDQNANLWLRKGWVTPSDAGGSEFDLPFTNSQVTVPGKHGLVNGQIIAAWNYLLSLNAGEYVQLWWQAEHIGVALETIPAGATPVTPVSPSVIVTMMQIR